MPPDIPAIRGAHGSTGIDRTACSAARPTRTRTRSRRQPRYCPPGVPSPTTRPSSALLSRFLLLSLVHYFSCQSRIRKRNTSASDTGPHIFTTYRRTTSNDRSSDAFSVVVLRGRFFTASPVCSGAAFRAARAWGRVTPRASSHACKRDKQRCTHRHLGSPKRKSGRTVIPPMWLRSLRTHILATTPHL
jgi:hypothetical protein